MSRAQPCSNLNAPPFPYTTLFGTYRVEECILTTPEGSLTDDSTEALWRMSFDLEGDDALHGTGATGAELNQRGTESVSDTPAAPALPMVWSTKGWGLYFNTLARVQHDLGHRDPDVYQVSMHEDRKSVV